MAQFTVLLDALVEKFVSKLARRELGDDSDTSAFDEKKAELMLIWKACTDGAVASVSWPDSDGEQQVVQRPKKSKKDPSTKISENGNTCVYVPTKGKSKGVVCGKKAVLGKKMCSVHKKNEDEVVEDDVESSKDEDVSQVEDTVDETVETKCVYVPTKGKSKGVVCGAVVVEGTDLCTKHTKKPVENEKKDGAKVETKMQVVKKPAENEKKDGAKVETKMQVVKKQNGRWVHQETGLVFKSSKERIIIGKMIEEEFTTLDKDDIPMVERHGFAYELADA